MNTNQLHNLATSLVQNDFKELTQQLLEKIVSKQIGQQDNLTDDLINSIIVKAIEEAFVRNWSYNDIQSITSFYFEDASTNRINILADDIDLNRNYEPQALTKLLIFVADHLQNLQPKSIDRFENTLQRLKDKLQPPNNDCFYLETIFNTAKNNGTHDKDPISQVLSEQKQNFLDYIIDGIEQGKTTEFMDWLIKHKSTDFTIDERHRILQAVAKKLKQPYAEKFVDFEKHYRIYEEYYLDLILNNYEKCPSAQSLIELCFKDSTSDFERLYYALDESQQNKLVHDALFNESASNNQLSHCPNPKGVLEFFNNNPNKLEAILNEQPADYKVTKTTLKRGVDWGLTQLTTTLLNHDRANTSDILDILSHNTTPSEKNMTDKACECFANLPGRLDELLEKQPVKQEQIDKAFKALTKDLTKEDDKSKIVTAAQLSRHISAEVRYCNQRLIHWLELEASSSMSNEKSDDERNHTCEKKAEENNPAYTLERTGSSWQTAAYIPESTDVSQQADPVKTPSSRPEEPATSSNDVSSRAEEEPATSSNQCKRSKRQPTLSSCVTAFFCRSSGGTQADDPSYAQSSKYQR